MTKLTKAQRANLDKLATYLEGLPKRYRHFDMSFWVKDSPSAAQLQYARHNGGVPSCGTAACAAGHGPAAGVLVPPRFIASGWVNWEEYCTVFTGDSARRSDWLFNGDWDLSDNHHFGAAARIRYLLDRGNPPEGFVVPGRKWRALYAPYRIDAKAKADA